MKTFFILCLAFLAGWFQLYVPSAPPAAPRQAWFRVSAEGPTLTVSGMQWPGVAITAYMQTGADPACPDGPVDSLFFLPTHAQLTEMDKAIRPKQHREYISEAWDCDDMMREWVVLTHRWAIDNVTHKAPISIATFGAYVRIHPGAFDGQWTVEGRHALGLVLDSDGVWWAVDCQSLLHVKVEEAYYEGSIEFDKIVW